MTAYALAALLVCGTAGWENGSLIVLEHSNKPVAAWTRSDVTHLALLLHIAGKPWVYEATPDKVRCLPLTTYCHELGELNRNRRQKTRMWVLQPKRPYSPRQLEKMKAYLDEQLGRRYSVKGYVRGRPSDGIHCAEFVSTALTLSGRYEFSASHRLNPAAVVRRAGPSHQPPAAVAVSAKPSSESWCQRSWERWFRFQNWCSWACHETWTFCW